MTTKKVFILQEIIPSYRVPVFRRLASLEGVDLTVFYSQPSKAMNQENLKNAKAIEGFRHIMIGHVEIGASNYQFGILWQVLTGLPDVMIAGKHTTLDGLLLLLLCKILRVRILWFLGGVPYVDERKIKEYANRGRLDRWLGRYNPKRILSLLADGIIAYTEHAKNFYIAYGFPREKIWVAPNSPDTESLHVFRQEWLNRHEDIDSERKRLSPHGEKILFLLGRLNNDRKVEDLLKSLAQLSEDNLRTSLVIVGDGGERARLESMVKELKLPRVFFEGAIYDEKILSKYFILSDIFVTPGVSSLAIKMAMFFGKPVVTVDYGLEVHDVQEGFNGYIFPMGNVDELTKRIRLLLQTEGLAERIGAAGQATMRDTVNIKKMVEGFRNAIFAE